MSVMFGLPTLTALLASEHGTGSIATVLCSADWRPFACNRSLLACSVPADSLSEFIDKHFKSVEADDPEETQGNFIALKKSFRNVENILGSIITTARSEVNAKL